MSLTEAIDALQQGDRSAVRTLRGTGGLSECYFLRIAQLLGSDPEAAIQLGREFRLLLKCGDRADFVWRGRGGALRAEGKWRASAAAFLEAGRAAHDPTERLTFTIGAIDSLGRAGLADDAVRLGRRLARRLRDVEPGHAARANLNLGNALIWQDRYREARAAYSKALDHVPTDFERAAVLLGRSTATLFFGKLSDARADALAAAELFMSLEMPVHAAQAEVNLARIDLLLGRPDDSWDRLRKLEAVLDDLPDRARILEFLGDTYFALNLYEDAVRAFRSGEAIARSTPLNWGNDWLGVGRSLDRLGRTREARDAFVKAAFAYRKAGNVPWVLTARAELARLDEDRSRLAGIARQLVAVGSKFAAAECALAAAEFGDAASLEQARGLINRFGYGSLRWKLNWLDARRSGRVADYRRMARRLVADRLAIRSVTARTAYLRDRGVALKEFLLILIEDGSPKALREALKWIGQSRSAALIDEILAGPGAEPLRVRLEWLRDRAGSGGGNDGTRSAGGWAFDAESVRLDGSVMGQVKPLGLEKEVQGDSMTVWVDLGENFGKLGSTAVGLVPARCIKEALRWLHFEMLAPMNVRGQDSQACGPLIAELRELLGSNDDTICPDGALWQVPWPVVMDEEPIIALSPHFREGADYELPPNPSVCVWAQIDPTLPSVAREIESLRARFPECVVCTTAEQARQSLELSWDYVHVAAHARTNRENPMFGYFEFSDGPLFGIQVARSPMQTELAVLAACDTARFNLDFPEEPHGMARAFLARGARAVVAAQWPLDDAAAYVTIESFIEALATGDPVRVALARARARCRQQFAHPYFWGALILIAGYHHDRP